ncbi:MAG: hypothetical protein U0792_24695 [Gemmataceae bacterium]
MATRCRSFNPSSGAMHIREFLLLEVVDQVAIAAEAADLCGRIPSDPVVPGRLQW